MKTTTSKEAFISVDVETAGPNSGQYSLLSIGACTIWEPQRSFYIELQPDKDAMHSEAFAIHGLTIAQLKKNGVPPARAMASFETWLNKAVPENLLPIFVAFNAPFDWMFVNEYFHCYLGYNPFGHAALDMKAFYMALTGSTWRETSMLNVSEKFLDGRKISHNALEDALNQAEIFRRMLDYRRQSKEL
jgi:ribonuclease T